MFAVLLLTAAPLLNLEDGQVFEIVGQLDCRVAEEAIDMRGAASTSAMGAGKKKVSLLFTTMWPADQPEQNKKIGLLALENQGGTTTLEELHYESEYVPRKAISSQPDVRPMLLFGSPTNFYTLSPRDGSSKWDYQQEVLLTHGAVQTYKGVCELRITSE